MTYRSNELGAFRGYYLRQGIGNVVLSGPKGVGKHSLALRLVRERLCMGKAFSENCECDSCRRIVKGVHPDVITVSPHEGYISKEQVVSLSETLIEPRVMADERVVIIDDANLMSESAQNALLKVTESGMLGNRFVFINHEQVLDTIRSRSAEFMFSEVTKTAFIEALGIEEESRAKLLYGLLGGRIGAARSFLEREGHNELFDAVSLILRKYGSVDYVDALMVFGLLEENKEAYERIVGPYWREVISTIEIFTARRFTSQKETAIDMKEIQEFCDYAAQLRSAHGDGIEELTLVIYRFLSLRRLTYAVS